MERVKRVAVRAAVTACEAAAGVLLAGGLADLDASRIETAAAAGAAAGLSVAYNAATEWLDRRRVAR